MIFGDYNSSDLLWLGDWGPGWIVMLILLGALVIGISAYDLKGLKPTRRWTLVTLRALVYLVAVIMLLEPALDLKNISKVKNHVVVLVDSSASMSLKVDDGQSSRLERVQKDLPQFAALEEQSKEEHEFHYFSYGKAPTETAQSSLQDLQKITPTGQHSNLSEALQDIQSKFADRELGGVVLYSDGIDTGALGHRTKEGEPLDATSVSLLKELDAPINTFGAANKDEVKDIAITRILRDDFAFVHNKVSVDVEIQAIGLGEQLVPVTLTREGAPLQTREIQITQDETSYKVSFEFVPRQIGQEIYTVEVPELDGETLKDNNRDIFLLRIIRDKIRALQVVGRPSWDERFMRRLLKQNPNVDLISFFILRTNESLHNASNDELSLIPFPTRELFEQELGSFDLVIFQNFNYGPYSMKRYLPYIEQFIEKGGGFAMLGGDLSFASGGYDNTAIEAALPVELPTRTSKLIDMQSFRPELTEAGQRHPITQLAFDPATNAKIWKNLPEQRGTNIVRAAKKGSTVLATHPKLTANGEPMPVITIGAHGKGRVMAMTTDSSWRWSFESLKDGGTPREYQLFWHNAIRWLIKDPELKLVKLELAKDSGLPAQQVNLSVRVSNPDYSPAQNRDGELRIVRRVLPYQGAQQEKLAPPQVIAFKTNSAGVAEIPFTPEQQGVYELSAHVKSADSKEDLSDQRMLLIVPNSQEYQNILPRQDLLESIAKVSEGTYTDLAKGTVTPQFVEPRSVKVNRRKVVQLWDSALTFLLILLLLGVEWTLRRRWGRL